MKRATLKKQAVAHEAAVPAPRVTQCNRQAFCLIFVCYILPLGVAPGCCYSAACSVTLFQSVSTLLSELDAAHFLVLLVLLQSAHCCALVHSAAVYCCTAVLLRAAASLWLLPGTAAALRDILLYSTAAKVLVYGLLVLNRPSGYLPSYWSPRMPNEQRRRLGLHKTPRVSGGGGGGGGGEGVRGGLGTISH